MTAFLINFSVFIFIGVESRARSGSIYNEEKRVGMAGNLKDVGGSTCADDGGHVALALPLNLMIFRRCITEVHLCVKNV